MTSAYVVTVRRDITDQFHRFLAVESELHEQTQRAQEPQQTWNTEATDALYSFGYSIRM